MNYTNSPFTHAEVKIDSDSKIVFVSDMFPEDYVGGAELTTQALIDSSQHKVFKLHAKDVTIETLKQGHSMYWIFGNATAMNPELIPTVVGNMKYSILEYDYKFCRARSTQKHKQMSGIDCDCHDQQIGKLISAWFYGADTVWWMSEKQKKIYTDRFPFLLDKTSMVLSSVFGFETLSYLKQLRESHKNSERKGWIVLGSDSWIKGVGAAKEWCENNKLEYEVVWNLPYEKVLEKLSTAEGFVYLPLGDDTCPRMVIEAKLLGCKLHLNEFVQHKDELWFDTDNLEEVESYLYSAHKTFWHSTNEFMDYKPTISGYTTTLNCVSQSYPFEQCIRSMLEFCDEVCVVDGGSTDGTLERLVKLVGPTLKDEEIPQFLEKMNEGLPFSSGPVSSSKRIVVKIVRRDWNDSHFAVFDGLQKAEARAMCNKEYCWQMDSDEIVHESDYEKIKTLCRTLPKEVDVLALPVVEYWGGYDKVRVDVNPWKWRLSRNKSNITHGIPEELRKYDSSGALYSAEGTDGCDMIDSTSHQRIPFMTFYTQNVDATRRAACNGDKHALQEYERWFNGAVAELPGVYHYSWFNLERKIRLYKNYWTSHWQALYGNEVSDTADSNMMFDLPWSKVTDEMIEKKAEELKMMTGGWVWHQKWRGQCLPHINCVKTSPKIMGEWK